MEIKPEEEVVVIEKKKGPKKKKWLLGSLVVIIVLGIFGATMANTVVAKVAPDKYIMLSLLQMKKLSDKEEKSVAATYPENRKTSVALNLKEIDGIDDDYFKELVEGSGVSFSISNSEAGDVLMDAGYKKDGANLMDISIYSSKDKLGLKIPGLLDQYVMVDLKQFKEKYDASDLSYYMGNIEQEDVDLVNHYITQGRNSLKGQVLGVDSSFNDDAQELLMDLAKSAKIKHAGGTKVTIDNKRKKADQFAITADSGDVKIFVKGMTKLVLKNTDLLNLISAYEGYYTKAELEEMVYEGLDEIKFSDVEIICAIDNKLRLATAEISSAISLDDEKIKFNSDFALSGKENVYDTVEVNYTMSSDDEKLGFTMVRDKTYSDKKTKVTENISFKVKENGNEIMKASFNIEEDLKATEDNFSATSSITIDEDSKVNVKLSGDFSEDKVSGESSLNAKKIELKIEEYGEALTIRGSGSFKTEDLKDKSIAISESQQLDLFSMGIGELINLASRIGSEFYDIGNALDYMY